MKRSKLIALSAIATAFSVIFMVIGAYIPVFDYSAIFMSSLCLMLPLSKNSKGATFMTYVATSILSAILIGGRWAVLVPYIVFFGLHPIANYFQIEKKINKYLALVIKDVWFVLSMLLVNFLFVDFFAVENAKLNEYLTYIIIFGGGILFVLYDLIMMRFQRVIPIIVDRLKL